MTVGVEDECSTHPNLYNLRDWKSNDALQEQLHTLENLLSDHIKLLDTDKKGTLGKKSFADIAKTQFFNGHQKGGRKA